MARAALQDANAHAPSGFTLGSTKVALRQVGRKCVRGQMKAASRSGVMGSC